MWADTENYFSSFYDIKFDIDIRFFDAAEHFISSFNIVKDGKKVKTLMMEKNGI